MLSLSRRRGSVLAALALLVGACQALLSFDDRSGIGSDAGEDAFGGDAIGVDAGSTDGSPGDTSLDVLDVPRDGGGPPDASPDAGSDAAPDAWTFFADFEDGGYGDFTLSDNTDVLGTIEPGLTKEWNVVTKADKATLYLGLTKNALPAFECELDWRIIGAASDAGPFSLVSLASVPGNVRRQVEIESDGTVFIHDYDMSVVNPVSPSGFDPTAWSHLRVRLQPASVASDVTLGAALGDAAASELTFHQSQGGQVVTIGPNGCSPNWTVRFDNVRCRLL